MIAAMVGKVALGMIEAKPATDAIGKVMGILAGTLFIRNTVIKEDADF